MSGIKKLVIGTAIFGIGAVVGYFVSKKVLEGQYREDVADVQDFYRQKLDEFGVMVEGFEPPEDGLDRQIEEDDEYDEEEIQKKEVIETYRGERRRYVTDYTKPSLDDMKRNLHHEGTSVVVNTNGEENLGNVDDEDEEDLEYTPSNDPKYEAELEKIAEDYARRRSENMKNGEPYLIEPEEYQEGPKDYDHQALYYYSKDRTLCEDDDSQVEDEEECVGLDYEDKLDMQTTCWVRNDKLRVLYEIHRIDDSYKKAVLGISETPREREFRIQGRRKQAMDDR